MLSLIREVSLSSCSNNRQPRPELPRPDLVPFTPSPDAHAPSGREVFVMFAFELLVENDIFSASAHADPRCGLASPSSRELPERHVLVVVVVGSGLAAAGSCG